MTIRIPLPHDYDFKQTKFFLHRGHDDLLHRIEGDVIKKFLIVKGEGVLINISVSGGELVIGSNHIITEAEVIREYVRSWFDLDRDLDPFYRMLEGSDYGSLKANRGLRIVGIPDLFEALSWSIIGQQINLTFAHKIKNALVGNYGRSFSENGNLLYSFPSPQIIADLSVDELMKIQFSQRKAEYLLGVAEKFSSGELDQEKLLLKATPAIIKELCEIRGIGEWTANYVAMKSLRKPDCIPWGDTGVQESIKRLLELDRKPTREEIQNVFDPFKGWESYLTFYLWSTLY